MSQLSDGDTTVIRTRLDHDEDRHLDILTGSIYMPYNSQEEPPPKRVRELVSYAVFNYFRMTPELFDELLSLIGPRIEKQELCRVPISSRTRLLILFFFIAHFVVLISTIDNRSNSWIDSLQSHATDMTFH
ncbi:hypothetical protein ALC62_05723 [Cyphomyrmex costatus]|uniref:Uncharacterized protein n=1 Tax=Cyphomyrmex costatus TaxID=456900 RepID=A0A151IJI3_9HYME|nr:hypothetical protein ALC62_05723 [Cyphomyrmex costatus]